MSAYAPAPSVYRDQAVLTATPEQLVVMLYDGANRFLTQSAIAMRDGRVFCHTSLAPESLIAETVGAQVRDCLAAVVVPREPFADGDVYRSETLLISVSSHCDNRCHVGRLASIDIRRRRADKADPPR